LIDLIKKFLFLDNINELISKNICKMRNVSIIILINPNKIHNQRKIEDFYNIISFCRNNHLPFYILNDYKLAVKTKAKGIYLESSNTKVIYKNFEKTMTIIGTAHNQIEYYFKKRQNCNLVFLSPIFLTKKYNENKILGPLKFNLITNVWKTKIGCLGGLTLNNYKKINLTKAKAIGLRSLISMAEIKKPVYF
jgi:thiamine monophosphate synthase